MSNLEDRVSSERRTDSQRQDLRHEAGANNPQTPEVLQTKTKIPNVNNNKTVTPTSKLWTTFTIHQRCSSAQNTESITTRKNKQQQITTK